jgi:HAD superfamily hydrolase (TIGR01662 family)
MVTNQSVVGRGIISLDLALEINEQVIADIGAQGGRVDASYLCPHHPDDGCSCRKPAPGMLQQAAKDLELDLTRSYVIGDAISDIEAADAVKAQGILVLTGRGKNQLSLLEMGKEAGCPVAADLEAAVDDILNHRGTTLTGQQWPSGGRQR